MVPAEYTIDEATGERVAPPPLPVNLGLAGEFLDSALVGAFVSPEFSVAPLRSVPVLTVSVRGEKRTVERLVNVATGGGAALETEVHETQLRYLGPDGNSWAWGYGFEVRKLSETAWEVWAVPPRFVGVSDLGAPPVSRDNTDKALGIVSLSDRFEAIPAGSQGRTIYGQTGNWLYSLDGAAQNGAYVSSQDFFGWDARAGTFAERQAKGNCIFKGALQSGHAQHECDRCLTFIDAPGWSHEVRAHQCASDEETAFDMARTQYAADRVAAILARDARLENLPDGEPAADLDPRMEAFFGDYFAVENLSGGSKRFHQFGSGRPVGSRLVRVDAPNYEDPDTAGSESVCVPYSEARVRYPGVEIPDFEEAVFVNAENEGVPEGTPGARRMTPWYCPPPVRTGKFVFNIRNGAYEQKCWNLQGQGAGGQLGEAFYKEVDCDSASNYNTNRAPSLHQVRQQVSEVGVFLVTVTVRRRMDVSEGTFHTDRIIRRNESGAHYPPYAAPGFGGAMAAVSRVTDSGSERFLVPRHPLMAWQFQGDEAVRTEFGRIPAGFKVTVFPAGIFYAGAESVPANLAYRARDLKNSEFGDRLAILLEDRKNPNAGGEYSVSVLAHEGVNLLEDEKVRGRFVSEALSGNWQLYRAGGFNRISDALPFYPATGSVYAIWPEKNILPGESISGRIRVKIGVGADGNLTEIPIPLNVRAGREVPLLTETGRTAGGAVLSTRRRLSSPETPPSLGRVQITSAATREGVPAIDGAPEGFATANGWQVVGNSGAYGRVAAGEATVFLRAGPALADFAEGLRQFSPESLRSRFARFRYVGAEDARGRGTSHLFGVTGSTVVLALPAPAAGSTEAEISVFYEDAALARHLVSQEELNDALAGVHFVYGEFVDPLNFVGALTVSARVQLIAQQQLAAGVSILAGNSAKLPPVGFSGVIAGDWSPSGPASQLVSHDPRLAGRYPTDAKARIPRDTPGIVVGADGLARAPVWPRVEVLWATESGLPPGAPKEWKITRVGRVAPDINDPYHNVIHGSQVFVFTASGCIDEFDEGHQHEGRCKSRPPFVFGPIAPREGYDWSVEGTLRIPGEWVRVEPSRAELDRLAATIRECVRENGPDARECLTVPLGVGENQGLFPQANVGALDLLEAFEDGRGGIGIRMTRPVSAAEVGPDATSPGAISRMIEIEEIDGRGPETRRKVTLDAQPGESALQNAKIIKEIVDPNGNVKRRNLYVVAQIAPSFRTDIGPAAEDVNAGPGATLTHLGNLNNPYYGVIGHRRTDLLARRPELAKYFTDDWARVPAEQIRAAIELAYGNGVSLAQTPGTYAAIRFARVAPGGDPGEVAHISTGASVRVSPAGAVVLDENLTGGKYSAVAHYTHPAIRGAVPFVIDFAVVVSRQNAIALLIAAVERGDHAEARRLLREHELDGDEIANGTTALHAAVRRFESGGGGNAKIRLVWLLAEYGASPWVVDSDGFAPLHLAMKIAGEGGSADGVSALMTAPFQKPKPGKVLPSAAEFRAVRIPDKPRFHLRPAGEADGIEQVAPGWHRLVPADPAAVSDVSHLTALAADFEGENCFADGARIQMFNNMTLALADRQVPALRCPDPAGRLKTTTATLSVIFIPDSRVQHRLRDLTGEVGSGRTVAATIRAGWHEVDIVSTIHAADDLRRLPLAPTADALPGCSESGENFDFRDDAGEVDAALALPILDCVRPVVVSDPDAPGGDFLFQPIIVGAANEKPHESVLADGRTTPMAYAAAQWRAADRTAKPGWAEAIYRLARLTDRADLCVSENEGDADAAAECVAARYLGVYELAESGDLEGFRAALEADLDIRNARGETALHVAVLTGNEVMARILLAAGADVNARAADGASPIHYAISMTNRAMTRLMADGFNRRVYSEALERGLLNHFFPAANRDNFCGENTQTQAPDGTALTLVGTVEPEERTQGGNAVAYACLAAGADVCFEPEPRAGYNPALPLENASGAAVEASPICSQIYGACVNESTDAFKTGNPFGFCRNDARLAFHPIGETYLPRASWVVANGRALTPMRYGGHLLGLEALNSPERTAMRDLLELLKRPGDFCGDAADATAFETCLLGGEGSIPAADAVRRANALQYARALISRDDADALEDLVTDGVSTPERELPALSDVNTRAEFRRFVATTDGGNFLHHAAAAGASRSMRFLLTAQAGPQLIFRDNDSELNKTDDRGLHAAHEVVDQWQSGRAAALVRAFHAAGADAARGVETITRGTQTYSLLDLAIAHYNQARGDYASEDEVPPELESLGQAIVFLNGETANLCTGSASPFTAEALFQHYFPDADPARNCDPTPNDLRNPEIRQDGTAFGRVCIDGGNSPIEHLCYQPQTSYDPLKPIDADAVDVSPAGPIPSDTPICSETADYAPCLSGGALNNSQDPFDFLPGTCPLSDFLAASNPPAACTLPADLVGDAPRPQVLYSWSAGGTVSAESGDAAVESGRFVDANVLLTFKATPAAGENVYVREWLGACAAAASPVSAETGAAGDFAEKECVVRAADSVEARAEFAVPLAVFDGNIFYRRGESYQALAVEDAANPGSTSTQGVTYLGVRRGLHLASTGSNGGEGTAEGLCARGGAAGGSAGTWRLPLFSELAIFASAAEIPGGRTPTRLDLHDSIADPDDNAATDDALLLPGWSGDESAVFNILPVGPDDAPAPSGSRAVAGVYLDTGLLAVAAGLNGLDFVNGAWSLEVRSGFSGRAVCVTPADASTYATPPRRVGVFTDLPAVVPGGFQGVDEIVSLNIQASVGARGGLVLAAASPLSPEILQPDGDDPLLALDVSEGTGPGDLGAVVRLARPPTQAEAGTYAITIRVTPEFGAPTDLETAAELVFVDWTETIYAQLTRADAAPDLAVIVNALANGGALERGGEPQLVHAIDGAAGDPDLESGSRAAAVTLLLGRGAEVDFFVADRFFRAAFPNGSMSQVLELFRAFLSGLNLYRPEVDISDLFTATSQNTGEPQLNLLTTNTACLPAAGAGQEEACAEIAALMHEFGASACSDSFSSPGRTIQAGLTYFCDIPAEILSAPVDLLEIGEILSFTARDFAGQTYDLRRISTAENNALLRAGWRLNLPPARPRRAVLVREREFEPGDISAVFTLTATVAGGRAVRHYQVAALFPPGGPAFFGKRSPGGTVAALLLDGNAAPNARDAASAVFATVFALDDGGNRIPETDSAGENLVVNGATVFRETQMVTFSDSERGDFVVGSGELVQFIATPDPGFYVAGWKGDCLETAQTTGRRASYARNPADIGSPSDGNPKNCFVNNVDGLAADAVFLPRAVAPNVQGYATGYEIAPDYGIAVPDPAAPEIGNVRITGVGQAVLLAERGPGGIRAWEVLQYLGIQRGLHLLDLSALPNGFVGVGSGGTVPANAPTPASLADCADLSALATARDSARTAAAAAGENANRGLRALRLASGPALRDARAGIYETARQNLDAARAAVVAAEQKYQACLNAEPVAHYGAVNPTARDPACAGGGANCQFHAEGICQRAGGNWRLPSFQEAFALHLGSSASNADRELQTEVAAGIDGVEASVNIAGFAGWNPPNHIIGIQDHSDTKGDTTSYLAFPIVFGGTYGPNGFGAEIAPLRGVSKFHSSNADLAAIINGQPNLRSAHAVCVSPATHYNRALYGASEIRANIRPEVRQPSGDYAETRRARFALGEGELTLRAVAWNYDRTGAPQTLPERLNVSALDGAGAGDFALETRRDGHHAQIVLRQTRANSSASGELSFSVSPESPNLIAAAQTFTVEIVGEPLLYFAGQPIAAAGDLAVLEVSNPLDNSAPLEVTMEYSRTGGFHILQRFVPSGSSAGPFRLPDGYQDAICAAAGHRDAAGNPLEFRPPRLVDLLERVSFGPESVESLLLDESSAPGAAGLASVPFTKHRRSPAGLANLGPRLGSSLDPFTDVQAGIRATVGGRIFNRSAALQVDFLGEPTDSITLNFADDARAIALCVSPAGPGADFEPRLVQADAISPEWTAARAAGRPLEAWLAGQRLAVFELHGRHLAREVLPGSAPPTGANQRGAAGRLVPHSRPDEVAGEVVVAESQVIESAKLILASRRFASGADLVEHYFPGGASTQCDALAGAHTVDTVHSDNTGSDASRIGYACNDLGAIVCLELSEDAATLYGSNGNDFVFGPGGRDICSGSEDYPPCVVDGALDNTQNPFTAGCDGAGLAATENTVAFALEVGSESADGRREAVLKTPSALPDSDAGVYPLALEVVPYVGAAQTLALTVRVRAAAAAAEYAVSLAASLAAGAGAPDAGQPNTVFAELTDTGARVVGPVRPAAGRRVSVVARPGDRDDGGSFYVSEWTGDCAAGSDILVRADALGDPADTGEKHCILAVARDAAAGATFGELTDAARRTAAAEELAKAKPDLARIRKLVEGADDSDTATYGDLGVGSGTSALGTYFAYRLGAASADQNLLAEYLRDGDYSAAEIADLAEFLWRAPDRGFKISDGHTYQASPVRSVNSAAALADGLDNLPVRTDLLRRYIAAFARFESAIDRNAGLLAQDHVDTLGIPVDVPNRLVWRCLGGSVQGGETLAQCAEMMRLIREHIPGECDVAQIPDAGPRAQPLCTNAAPMVFPRSFSAEPDETGPVGEVVGRDAPGTNQFTLFMDDSAESRLTLNGWSAAADYSDNPHRIAFSRARSFRDGDLADLLVTVYQSNRDSSAANQRRNVAYDVRLLLPGGALATLSEADALVEFYFPSGDPGVYCDDATFDDADPTSIFDGSAIYYGTDRTTLVARLCARNPLDREEDYLCRQFTSAYTGPGAEPNLLQDDVYDFVVQTVAAWNAAPLCSEAYPQCAGIDADGNPFTTDDCDSNLSPDDLLRLHLAPENDSDPNYVRGLLAAGANPVLGLSLVFAPLVDDDGEVQQAAFTGTARSNVLVPDLSDRGDIARLLVQAGASPDTRTRNGAPIPAALAEYAALVRVGAPPAALGALKKFMLAAEAAGVRPNFTQGVHHPYLSPLDGLANRVGGCVRESGHFLGDPTADEIAACDELARIFYRRGASCISGNSGPPGSRREYQATDGSDLPTAVKSWIDSLPNLPNGNIFAANLLSNSLNNRFSGHFRPYNTVSLESLWTQDHFNIVVASRGYPVVPPPTRADVIRVLEEVYAEGLATIEQTFHRYCRAESELSAGVVSPDETGEVWSVRAGDFAGDVFDLAVNAEVSGGALGFSAATLHQHYFPPIPNSDENCFRLHDPSGDIRTSATHAWQGDGTSGGSEVVGLFCFDGRMGEGRSVCFQPQDETYDPAQILRGGFFDGAELPAEPFCSEMFPPCLTESGELDSSANPFTDRCSGNFERASSAALTGSGWRISRAGSRPQRVGLERVRPARDSDRDVILRVSESGASGRLVRDITRTASLLGRPESGEEAVSQVVRWVDSDGGGILAYVGGLAVENGGTVAAGSRVRFVATPEGENFVSSWSGSCGMPLSGEYARVAEAGNASDLGSAQACELTANRPLSAGAVFLAGSAEIALESLSGGGDLRWTGADGAVLDLLPGDRFRTPLQGRGAGVLALSGAGEFARLLAAGVDEVELRGDTETRWSNGGRDVELRGGTMLLDREGSRRWVRRLTYDEGRAEVLLLGTRLSMSVNGAVAAFLLRAGVVEINAPGAPARLDCLAGGGRRAAESGGFGTACTGDIRAESPGLGGRVLVSRGALRLTLDFGAGAAEFPMSSGGARTFISLLDRQDRGLTLALTVRGRDSETVYRLWPAPGGNSASLELTAPDDPATEPPEALVSETSQAEITRGGITRRALCDGVSDIRVSAGGGEVACAFTETPPFCYGGFQASGRARALVGADFAGQALCRLLRLRPPPSYAAGSPIFSPSGAAMIDARGDVIVADPSAIPDEPEVLAFTGYATQGVADRSVTLDFLTYPPTVVIDFLEGDNFGETKPLGVGGMLQGAFSFEKTGGSPDYTINVNHLAHAQLPPNDLVGRGDAAVEFSAVLAANFRNAPGLPGSGETLSPETYYRAGVSAEALSSFSDGVVIVRGKGTFRPMIDVAKSGQGAVTLRHVGGENDGAVLAEPPRGLAGSTIRAEATAADNWHIFRLGAEGQCPDLIGEPTFASCDIILPEAEEFSLPVVFRRSGLPVAPLRDLQVFVAGGYAGTVGMLAGANPGAAVDSPSGKLQVAPGGEVRLLEATETLLDEVINIGGQNYEVRVEPLERVEFQIQAEAGSGRDRDFLATLAVGALAGATFASFVPEGSVDSYARDFFVLSPEGVMTRESNTTGGDLELHFTVADGDGIRGTVSGVIHANLRGRDFVAAASGTPDFHGTEIARRGQVVNIPDGDGQGALLHGVFWGARRGLQYIVAKTGDIPLATTDGLPLDYAVPAANFLGGFSTRTATGDIVFRPFRVNPSPRSAAEGWTMANYAAMCDSAGWRPASVAEAAGLVADGAELTLTYRTTDVGVLDYGAGQFGSPRARAVWESAGHEVGVPGIIPTRTLGPQANTPEGRREWIWQNRISLVAKASSDWPALRPGAAVAGYSGVPAGYQAGQPTSWRGEMWAVGVAQVNGEGVFGAFTPESGFGLAGRRRAPEEGMVRPVEHLHSEALLYDGAAGYAACVREVSGSYAAPAELAVLEFDYDGKDQACPLDATPSAGCPEADPQTGRTGSLTDWTEASMTGLTVTLRGDGTVPVMLTVRARRFGRTSDGAAQLENADGEARMARAEVREFSPDGGQAGATIMMISQNDSQAVFAVSLGVGGTLLALPNFGGDTFPVNLAVAAHPRFGTEARVNLKIMVDGRRDGATPPAPEFLSDTCPNTAHKIFGRVARRADGTLDDRRLCRPNDGTSRVWVNGNFENNSRVCRAFDGTVRREANGDIFCDARFSSGTHQDSPNSTRFCKFGNSGADNCRSTFDATAYCNAVQNGRPQRIWPNHITNGCGNTDLSCGADRPGRVAIGGVCKVLEDYYPDCPTAVLAGLPRPPGTDELGPAVGPCKPPDGDDLVLKNPTESDPHPLEGQVSLPPLRVDVRQGVGDSSAGPLVRRILAGAGYTGPLWTLSPLVEGLNVAVRQIGADAGIVLDGRVARLTSPVVSVATGADGYRLQSRLTAGVRAGSSAEVTVVLAAELFEFPPLDITVVKGAAATAVMVSPTTESDGTVLTIVTEIFEEPDAGGIPQGVLLKLPSELGNGPVTWTDTNANDALRVLPNGGILAARRLEFDFQYRGEATANGPGVVGVRASLKFRLREGDSTRMIAAVRAQNLALVRSLPDDLAAVSDADGNVPLHHAATIRAAVGATIISELAGKDSAALEVANGKGWTPLFAAVAALRPTDSEMMALGSTPATVSFRPFVLNAVSVLIDEGADADGAGDFPPLGAAFREALYGSRNLSNRNAGGCAEAWSGNVNEELVAAVKILRDAGASPNLLIPGPNPGDSSRWGFLHFGAEYLMKGTDPMIREFVRTGSGRTAADLRLDKTDGNHPLDILNYFASDFSGNDCADTELPDRAGRYTRLGAFLRGLGATCGTGFSVNAPGQVCSD